MTWDWIAKDSFLCNLSQTSWSGESWLPYCEDTQAVLLKRFTWAGTEVSCQLPREWTIMEKNLTSPAKPQALRCMELRQMSWLQFPEILSLKHPAMPCLKSLKFIVRSEMFIFKLLSYGVIYYIAADSYYIRLCAQVCLFAIPWTAACQAPLSMGFFQARILEWVAISSSKGIFLTQGSNPRLLRFPHWQVGSLPLRHLGSPLQRTSAFFSHLHLSRALISF